MSLNVNRQIQDAFYRYKMPRLQAKVEGKGNGVKTVIPNMADIARALGRPPTCKYIFSRKKRPAVRLISRNFFHTLQILPSTLDANWEHKPNLTSRTNVSSLMDPMTLQSFKTCLTDLFANSYFAKIATIPRLTSKSMPNVEFWRPLAELVVTTTNWICDINWPLSFWG